MKRSLLLLALLGLAVVARADVDEQTVSIDDALEEEDVEVVSSEGDLASEAEDSQPPQQQELSPEQQRMQARLQRRMIGYILEEATPDCATELREVLSMSPEQQQQRSQETEGKMFSEECNTEINGKAAEFQGKVQSGQVTFDPNEEDEAEQAAAAAQAAGGAAVAKEAGYQWSTSQIVSIILLAVSGLLGGLYLLAKRRTAAFEAWLDEEPGRRAKYEKKMKAKASGPME